MPFLSEAQHKNYQATKETLARILATLQVAENNNEQPNYLLSMYLHIYNNFTGNNGLKADAFLALVAFCERLGRVDIMVSQLHSVEKLISGWTLTPPEKRHLLREVYLALDRI